MVTPIKRSSRPNATESEETMALLSDYTAGTVSSADNVITGTGTAWQTAAYGEGDEFTAPGWNVRVLEVVGETQLIVDTTRGVVGPELSNSKYGLRRSAANARASEQARHLIDILGNAGSLEALAEVVGTPDTVPYFTGPGSMGLIPLSEIGSRPPPFTVATAPSASEAGEGAMIYVTDEAGGAIPAFSDGTDWRRMSDRAVIS